jgi:glycosyl transferase group 2
MNARVNILLSTYNGEQYLSEQLDSLLQQTYPNITIYVRDDGSDDHTLQILEKYQTKCRERQDGGPQIVILQEENPANLGYMKSFWTLLQKCERADYYAFCDQDDVWLPTKIECGVAAMEREKNDIPILYSSGFVYCNENMEVTGYPVQITVPVEFKDVLFYTPAFGFTIMINNKLREQAFSASSLEDMPHDGWCQKIAASMGKFVYDRTVTAKYRRHASTVTYAGGRKLNLVFKWIKNEIFGDGMEEYYRVLRHFYDEYEKVLSDENKEKLYVFTKREKSFSLYLKRLFWKERLRPSLGGEAALRISFLLNK